MATVRCSHCGAAFSSHKKECPECGAVRNKGGARLKPRSKSNSQLIITVVLILAIIICAVILIKMIVNKAGGAAAEEPSATSESISPNETADVGEEEPSAMQPVSTPTATPVPTQEPIVEVTSIVLNREDVTFVVGEQFTFKATTDPEGVEVIWDSANDAIVQIDEEGNATAMGIGTSEIAASAGGKSVTCIIRVK